MWFFLDQVFMASMVGEKDRVLSRRHSFGTIILLSSSDRLCVHRFGCDIDICFCSSLCYFLCWPGEIRINMYSYHFLAIASAHVDIWTGGYCEVYDVSRSYSGGNVYRNDRCCYLRT